MRERALGHFLVSLGLGLLPTLSGCGGKDPASPPAPPAAGVEPSAAEVETKAATTELTRVQESLKSAEEETARLRKVVSERDAELTALEEEKASLELELQSALDEIIRSQASLRNVQSRAFAVSRIAEVRVELESFRASKDPALKDRLDRADDFLKRADGALQQDNVGGATYLAERASELVRQVKTVAEIRRKEPKELIPIVPPRILEVRSTANLRNAPAADGERVGSVEPGMKLKAVARQGEWFKIETEGGAEAWIHRRLVR